jgi:ADP-heptose:LPS heptosyltransferase
VRQIYSVAPRPPWPGPHAAEHIFAPLTALGLRPRLAPPRVDDRALAGLNLPDQPIVLTPGAAAGEKVWPGYALLAERLPEERLLWAPGRDEPWSAPARGRSLPALDLPGLVALASRAAAWVGNDTGTTHLAAAAAPGRVLALFGPTRPETWGPVGARSIAFADAADVHKELTRILNRGTADRTSPE